MLAFAERHLEHPVGLQRVAAVKIGGGVIQLAIVDVDGSVGGLLRGLSHSASQRQ